MALLAGLFLWPVGRAAQTPAGPIPGHPPVDQPISKGPAQASADEAKPNLSGAWTLNKNQSDDPRKAMQEARGNPGGMGGRGGWGGMEGRGRGGYGERGGENASMMKEFNQLTITQSGFVVKISGSSGRVLAQSASSDQDHSTSTNEASASVPTGAWQGNQFVVITQSNRGGKTMRTYELSQDAKQLYVTTRIDSPRFNQPVKFRLVYDSGKSNSGGSQ